MQNSDIGEIFGVDVGLPMFSPQLLFEHEQLKLDTMSRFSLCHGPGRIQVVWSLVLARGFTHKQVQNLSKQVKQHVLSEPHQEFDGIQYSAYLDYWPGQTHNGFKVHWKQAQ